MDERNPLWMPKGSVRSLIALALTTLVAWLLITGQGDLTGRVPPEVWTAYGAVLGFYFAGAPPRT